MFTEQMRDEYIRQRIQYENLRRANKFFVSALFVVPSVMLILELCRNEELWHYGNTWIWMLVVVAMFVSMIFGETFEKYAWIPYFIELALKSQILIILLSKTN